MVQQSVLAIYENRVQAQQAIIALRNAGVPPGSISMISKPEQLPPAPSEEEDLQADVTLGAAVGGGVGILAGGVVLLASGVGSLAVVGALVAALGGATTGSLIGLLAGYSVTEEDVTGYENLLAEGRVLVFVHGPARQIALAQHVFEAGPPCLLHLHGEVQESLEA